MRYGKEQAGGKGRLGIVVILAVLVVVAGWVYWARSKRIHNVVLISLDTCRADYLSCYGFERKTTPNIDELAAEGIMYTHAISPIGLTLPAHSSVLTGTYPPFHRVHDNLGTRLGDSSVTVAEVLSEAGFRTGAIVSTFVLDSQFGTYQGFDSYDDDFEVPIGITDSFERRGDETTDHALEYLEEHQEERFFLFLHYYDAHTPYIPLEPFASEYADDLYAGEVAFTDHCVGRVVKKLKELDLYENTLFVIMGDHGESLGEHGQLEHGYFVYQADLHVPLIMRGPGMAGGVKVDEVASLVDIMPTILGYLEIEAPKEVQGRDLSAGGQEAGGGEERQVYCEAMTATKYGCNPLLGLVGNKWKYIETKEAELYDLEGDGGELNNGLVADPEMGRYMSERLAEMTSRLVLGQLGDEQMVMDEESLKRLESLGYVGGESVETSFTVDESKADPKERIGYHEARVKVNYLLCEQKYDEALAVCAEMLAEFPEIPNTYAVQGKLTFKQGKFAEAIEHNSKYLALVTEGQWGGDGFKPAALPAPAVGAIRFLGLAYVGLEQYEEAEKCFRTMLAKSPGDIEVQDHLATTLYRLERWDEALAIWREVVKLRAQSVKLHRSMGGAYQKKGDLAKALEHWEQVVRLEPMDLSVKNNVAWILATTRDEELRNVERAVELGEQICEKTEYKLSSLLDTLGVAYAAAGRFAEAIEVTEKAIGLAREAGRETEAAEVEKHLELYRQGKSYRE